MPDLKLNNNSQPDHGRAMDQLLEALLEEQADTPPWIRPVPRSQDPGDGHQDDGEEDGQEQPRKRFKNGKEEEQKKAHASQAAANDIACCLRCINDVPHEACRQLVISFLPRDAHPAAAPQKPACGEPESQCCPQPRQ